MAWQANSANTEEETSGQPLEEDNKEEMQEDKAASPPAEVGALPSEGEEADQAVTLEVHPIGYRADCKP